MKYVRPSLGRRFTRSLFAASKRRRKVQARRRSSAIRFESLEARLMLAADLGHDQPFVDLAPPELNAADLAQQAEGEGGVEVGEGEPAQDLVAFAQALTASGTRFFGASWCPPCTSQKEQFEDGADFLPFIEVTNLDSPVTLNAVGRGEDLTLNPTGVPVNNFPTWEFPDGSRLTGEQSLETISQRSGVAIPSSDQPFIAPVDDGDLDPTDVDEDGDDIVTLLGGSPLHIPLDGYDPGGGPLTYTVSSSDESLVSTTLVTGNPSWQIDVDGWGKMTFLLFGQRASRPTSRLIDLAQSDFYDSVTFHRIVNGFVIQGGDPTGTGSGGSQLGDFDDQFHEDLQHNRTGTLSYAKTSDDTNDSQFFITEGATRHLDGNHSVAGVLVEGEKNREAISNNSTSNPRSVVMNSVDPFTDTENAVVMLAAAEGATGEADITVTATDSDGNTFTRSFHVHVQPDTSNTSPWLDDIGTLTAITGNTLTTQIRAHDIEGDPIQFGVLSPPSLHFNINVPGTPITPQSPADATITVSPIGDFVGQENATFYVFDPTSINLDGVTVTESLLQSNSSVFDVQTVMVEAEGNPVAAPSSIDLTAATDSGGNFILANGDSDNLTNFDNSSPLLALEIEVTADQGALVDLLLDGVVIDQKVADGPGPVTFTTDGSTPLNQGIRRFSASQEIGGVRGAEIHLDVTIDSVVPVFTTTAPTAPINADDIFLYDSTTTEEDAPGAIFTLWDRSTGNQVSGNPATGPIITVNRGGVTWDPPEPGDHQFFIQFEDAAGNVVTQDLNLTVLETPVVEFQFVPIKDGTIVTDLSVGEQFTLNVFVQDLRGLPEGSGGAFSAYVDVLFNQLLARPVGDLRIDPTNFPSVNLGDLDTPGLIDGAGGVAGLSPTGPTVRLLFSQDFEAIAGGTLSFTGESTSDPDDPLDADQLTSRAINLYDLGLPVCPTTGDCTGSISFVNPDPIAIDSNFTLLNPVIGPNEDGSTSLTIEQLAEFNTGVTGTLVISEVGQPASGQVSVAPDNMSLTYTPNPDYFGPDEYSYTIRNDTGDLGVGTVSVSVQPVNDAPTAVNDSFEDPVNGQHYVIPEDNPNNFLPVLDNDLSDPDDRNSEELSVDTVPSMSAQGGSVQRASSGQGLLYTPPPNFIGMDTITYTIRDSGGAVSGQATVTVDVREQNDPPLANNDVFPVNGTPILEDSQANRLDVLFNDSDGPDEGETLTIRDVSQPPSGTVEIIENGAALSYTPNANFFGQDIFTYTIDDRADGNGARATASVTVTVTGVNDPPDARDDIGPPFLVVRDSQNNSLDVRLNDTAAPDGDELLTIVSVSGVTPGADVQIVNGAVNYTPVSGFLGTDTFTYTIQDPDGLTDSATVTVSVSDFVPGSLQGFVYVDANNDGIRDPSERPLPNVTISLTRPGNLVQTTTTDANGEYSFAGLAPGDYMIEETQPPQDLDADGVPLLDGRDSIGSQGGDASENDKFSIMLAEGVDGVDNNFAEVKGFTLTGGVYQNAVNGGLTPLHGLGGLDVRVFNVDASDQPVGDALRIGKTSLNGAFSFDGLPPDEYQIDVAQPDFLVNLTPMTTQVNGPTANADFEELRRDPTTISYRDFVNRSTDSALLALASGETSERWFALDGWDGLTSFSSALAGDGSAITLEMTDDSGTSFVGLVPTSDGRVHRLGSQPDGAALFRLDGGRAAYGDVLLASEPTNGGSGEGEGEPASQRITLPATQPPLLVQPVLEVQPILVTDPVVIATPQQDPITDRAEGEAAAAQSSTALSPIKFTSVGQVGLPGVLDASPEAHDTERAAAIDAVFTEPFELLVDAVGAVDSGPQQDDAGDLDKLATSIIAQEDLLPVVDEVFSEA